MADHCTGSSRVSFKWWRYQTGELIGVWKKSDKFTIENSRQYKVDAGAEYIVTQMFFDNDKYYEFVDQCRAEGINVPIIPGLKILTSKNQNAALPKNFFIDVPAELSSEIMEAKPEHVLEIGVEWTCKQVEDLLNKGVPAIHFYIMQKANPINMLMKKLNI